MDYNQDTISIYLAKQCKESLQNVQKRVVRDIQFKGQWKSQQWLLYVCYTLKYFKKSLESNERIISFRDNRRLYKSFDRGYVNFIQSFGLHQFINEIDRRNLIKRAKSKFGSLKRSYRQKNRNKSSRSESPLDYQNFIYCQGKKMLEDRKSKQMIALRQTIEEYQREKRKESDLRSVQTLDSRHQRDIKTFRKIKTRSLTIKDQQNGNTYI